MRKSRKLAERGIGDVHDELERAGPRRIHALRGGAEVEREFPRIVALRVFVLRREEEAQRVGGALDVHRARGAGTHRAVNVQRLRRIEHGQSPRLVREDVEQSASRGIEAHDTAAGGDGERGVVRARRGVHSRCGIEPAPPEFRAAVGIERGDGVFAEDKEPPICGERCARALVPRLLQLPVWLAIPREFQRPLHTLVSLDLAVRVECAGQFSAHHERALHFADEHARRRLESALDGTEHAAARTQHAIPFRRRDARRIADRDDETACERRQLQSVCREDMDARAVKRCLRDKPRSLGLHCARIREHRDDLKLRPRRERLREQRVAPAEYECEAARIRCFFQRTRERRGQLRHRSHRCRRQRARNTSTKNMQRPAMRAREDAPVGNCETAHLAIRRCLPQLVARRRVERDDAAFLAEKNRICREHLGMNARARLAPPQLHGIAVHIPRVALAISKCEHAVTRQQRACAPEQAGGDLSAPVLLLPLRRDGLHRGGERPFLLARPRVECGEAVCKMIRTLAETRRHIRLPADRGDEHRAAENRRPRAALVPDLGTGRVVNETARFQIVSRGHAAPRRHEQRVIRREQRALRRGAAERSRRHMRILDVFVAARVVAPALGTGRRVERENVNAFARPHARGDIHDAAAHEHATAARPARGDAAIRDHLTAIHAEVPRPQLRSRRCIQAARHAIIACEIAAPIFDLRSKPHRPAHGELPAQRATRRVECAHRVIRRRSEKNCAARDNRLRCVIEIERIQRAPRLAPRRSRRLALPRPRLRERQLHGLGRHR